MAQRAFFAQLAADARYRLDWQLVDPQRNTDASVAAMQGDEAPMRNLLDEITKPITWAAQLQALGAKSARNVDSRRESETICDERDSCRRPRLPC